MLRQAGSGGGSMMQDFQDITFNRNHRQESAAREAAIGLRYVIAAIAMNIVVIVLALVVEASSVDGAGILALPVAILAICAFGCGAYGIYSMLDALGWSGFASAFVIASLLVPYFKLVTLIVVSVLALNLVRNNGFGFRLFGPLEKR